MRERTVTEDRVSAKSEGPRGQRLQVPQVPIFDTESCVFKWGHTLNTVWNLLYFSLNKNTLGISLRPFPPVSVLVAVPMARGWG